MNQNVRQLTAILAKPEWFQSSVLSLVGVLLAGWFLFVVATTSEDLLPSRVQIPEATSRNLYLDDFVVFFAAGDGVSDGVDVYDPLSIRQKEAELTGQNPDTVRVLPFFNPPSSLLLFGLLAVLPLGVAAALFMVSTAAGAVIANLALARTLNLRLTPAQATLAVLAVLSSFPLFQVLIHGQITFLLLIGFCAFFLAFSAPRYRTVLVVVGISLIAIKPSLLIAPLLYLVLTKEWPLIAKAAAVQAILLLLSVVIFQQTSLPLRWLELVTDALAWDEQNGISTRGMFGWLSWIFLDCHLPYQIRPRNLTLPRGKPPQTEPYMAAPHICTWPKVRSGEFATGDDAIRTGSARADSANVINA